MEGAWADAGRGGGRRRAWWARKPHRSIRVSLMALVVCCILPSLVALGIIVYEDHLKRVDETRREAVLRARGLMAAIDRDLMAVESTLTVLATSQRLASGDLTAFAARLRDAPRPSIVTDFGLADREGHELLTAALVERPLLPTPNGVPAEVMPVFRTGQPLVSPQYEGQVDRLRSLALAVPVRRNGEIVYVLCARIAPERLTAVLARYPLPPQWVASLVDERGAVVTRFASDAAGAGRVEPSIARALDADSALHDDESVITALTPSSMSGMRMVVAAPRATLSSNLSRSMIKLVAAGLASLGIALWFAIRLSGNIRRSVEGLIEPALALGSGRPVELSGSTIVEADAVGRALQQASQMLAQANHQAHHDPLTGLCNRTLFDELVAHQLAAAERSGGRLAVVAIDLDGFKAVNDQHGHAAGDLVLKTAADRIQKAIRGADVVSRRGGDEFTVLLNHVDQPLAQRIGEKLVATLARPYDGIDVAVSASVGIVLYPESGTTLAGLLERADRALYEAKKAGKRRLAGDVLPGRDLMTRLTAWI